MTGKLSNDAPPPSGRPKLALLGAAGALDLAGHLRRVSAVLLDAEPPPAAATDALATQFGYRTLSARTGEVGSLRALLQVVRTAISGHLPANWMWTRADGTVVDGLRARIDPGGVATAAELLFLRHAHQKALLELLRTADELILLLTGASCVVDAQHGDAYSDAPDVTTRLPDGASLVTHASDLEALNTDFDEICALLSGINPRLLLRVALVPLPVDQHQAGSDFALSLPALRQQSDLRVMMAHWSATRPQVDYLPLWELCTGQLARMGQFSPETGQLTAEGGLQAAWLCMGYDAAPPVAPLAALAAADDADAAMAKKRARRAQKRADRAQQGGNQTAVICEEELLEAFSK